MIAIFKKYFVNSIEAVFLGWREYTTMALPGTVPGRAPLLHTIGLVDLRPEPVQ